MALENSADLRSTAEIMTFETKARSEAEARERRCYAHERSTAFYEQEYRMEIEANGKLATEAKTEKEIADMHWQRVLGHDGALTIVNAELFRARTELAASQHENRDTNLRNGPNSSMTQLPSAEY